MVVTSLLPVYQKGTDETRETVILRPPFKKRTWLMENKTMRQYQFPDNSSENSSFNQDYLYSSLMPYARMISGSSAITALAAAFMSSRARRSLGFSNAYLSENLLKISIVCDNRHRGSTYESPVHLYEQRSMCLGAEDRSAQNSSHIHIWKYINIAKYSWELLTDLEFAILTFNIRCCVEGRKDESLSRLDRIYSLK